MKHCRAILVVCVGCMATLAEAQAPVRGQEFLGLKNINLLETPHYRIYYAGKSAAAFRTVAENVWSESARLLPRIPVIFEKGDWAAELPRDDKGQPVFSVSPSRARRPSPSRLKMAGAAESLKIDLVFIENRSEYESAARRLLPDGLDGGQIAQAETVIAGTSTFADQDRRARVFWSDDPNLKRQGFDIFVAHCLATDLMTLHQGREPPLWLAAGYGYYMEFFLFKKSVTAYLDYEGYYDEHYGADGGGGGGRLDPRETLSVGEPWAPILKTLMKKGKPGQLKTVFAAETANLTPEACGYMYALMSFFASDSARAEKFARALLKAREREDVRPDGFLAESLGFPNMAALQDAWHKYMLSPAFR